MTLAAIGIWQIFVIIMVLLALVMTITALVDIVNSKFEGDKKTVWIVVVILLGVMGAIAYFIIGRKDKLE